MDKKTLLLQQGHAIHNLSLRLSSYRFKVIKWKGYYKISSLHPIGTISSSWMSFTEFNYFLYSVIFPAQGIYEIKMTFNGEIEWEIWYDL